MDWASELAHELAGQVLVDDASRDSLSTDFGRIIVRKPAAVVRPASTDDVARVIKFAAGRGLTIATRGGGHSQTGQSLSDHILLDLTSLDKILDVQPSQGSVTCQGGLKWRSLVEQLAPQQLSPPVLTNNLDVTLGGTLSVAGLGVASWRYGTQADNCEEFEVVTGAGDVVRCSRQRNPELFDAARAGMGQFAVITEAKVKIRRHQPQYRSYYLLYDDMAVLLDDLKLVMADERFDYLESWCVPCPQGFRKTAGTRQAFAQWFYPLHATIEADAKGDRETEKKLQGLKFYKHVHTEEGEILEFYKRLDDLFVIWKRAGFWEYAHPWMECVLPWETTAQYIGQVLQNMPPQSIAGGHILLWPGRGDVSKVPLFMRPSSSLVMGFGILPAVPPRFLEEALPKLNMASQASIWMGAKRYLSGWIGFDAAQWKAHYGDQWPTVVSLKKKYDPHGVLNPGFIKFGE